MVAPGTRFNEGKLETRESWVEEDRVSGKSHEKMTMDAVRDMASSIFPWLQFTGELTEDQTTRMVPMLGQCKDNDKNQITLTGWTYWQETWDKTTATV